MNLIHLAWGVIGGGLVFLAACLCGLYCTLNGEFGYAVGIPIILFGWAAAIGILLVSIWIAIVSGRRQPENQSNEIETANKP